VWTRDLDLLVPLWQGADDVRVRDGAAALGALIPPGPARVVVPVPGGGSARSSGVRHRAAVARAVRDQQELLRQHGPGRLLTLGGDCTVEVAAVAHLAGRYGPRLFVLWIDAHADLNTPETSPSGTAHGMPLRLLLRPDRVGPPGPITPLPAPGCLTPEQVALAGVRDLDPAEARYIEEHALPRVTVADLDAAPGTLAVLAPAGAAVYVHLDLDVIEESELPAVAVPTPGGVPVASLVRALAMVQASHEVVGVGITEYVPQVAHDRDVLARLAGALGLSRSG